MFSRQICFAAVLFGSLVSVTALAADRKRMPATECLLTYDDPVLEGNDLWDRGFARFGTEDPNRPMNVVCPLIRSNTTNTNGLTSLRVNLTKGASTLFTCYAQSMDQNGSFLKRVANSTNVTGLIALTWANSLNVSSSKGTYGISCEVYGRVFPAWGDELESVEYIVP